jgi:hypothetical protein
MNLLILGRNSRKKPKSCGTISLETWICLTIYFQLKGIAEVFLHKAIQPPIASQSTVRLCTPYCESCSFYQHSMFLEGKDYSASLPVLAAKPPLTYSPFCSIQPRPTPHNSPLTFLSQTRKHTQTQIQICCFTSHTTIHNFDIYTPIPSNSRIISCNPYHLSTQWIVI